MSRERESFEDWYRSLHPQLVTSLAASIGNAELARDATDEALARAYERWSEVRLMDSPRGWTYRVAFNVARRRLRRRNVEKVLLLRSPIRPHVEGPSGELWQAVAGLPPRQRQAVALRHVGDLAEAEIASVMGISRGGVSSTLRAAYESLRLQLTEP
jgi:RNA polymerase sigma-70 factor (ECF subfamily)